jgi:hypothetical protein
LNTILSFSQVDFSVLNGTDWDDAGETATEPIKNKKNLRPSSPSLLAM